MNIPSGACVNKLDLCDSDGEEHNYAVSSHPTDNPNPHQSLNIKTEMDTSTDMKVFVKSEPFILCENIKQEFEAPTASTSRLQADDDRDYKTFTWSTPGKQEIGVAGVIRNMKVEAVEDEQSENSSSNVTNLNEANLSIYKCNKCNLNFDDPQIMVLHVKSCNLTLNESTSDKYSEDVVNNLIKNISNHICLYNKQHRQYKDSNYKKTVWEIIARSCDLENGYVAKTLWKEIKRNFLEYLSQTNPRKRSKWHHHFKSLQFVLPFENNLPENYYALVVDLETQNISDSSNETSPLGESSNKRARLSDSGLSSEHRSRRTRRLQEWKMLKEKISDHKKQSHPLDTFFLSMRETTKTLPLHLQIQVKKHVFKAVVEAEGTALNSLGQQESLSSGED